MISPDPTLDDDDHKGLLHKKTELNLQPVSSDIPYVHGDDLAAISALASGLADSTADYSIGEEKRFVAREKEQTFLTGELQAKKGHDNAAVNIVRGKLERIYAVEPDADEEAVESFQAGDHRTKHQKYMLDLTNSGRSLADIQVTWHNYYAGLPDNEKHEVWQEFYSAHAHPPTPTAPKPQESPVSQHVIGAGWAEPKPVEDTRTMADIRHQVMRKAMPKGAKMSTKHHIQSLLFGAGMASLVLVLMLFGFFNERFIAPFISPSRQVSATPILGTSGDIGPDNEIIIPKINLEVPVVYGTDTTSEQVIQNNLEDGVVHYSTSAMPGQNGNVVVVGHSSNNILNKGKYKFAFVLLKRLEIGDTFSFNKDGTRYTYQIYEKKVVKPTDVSVLGSAPKANSATLITCDPPGTSLNRLIIIGQQISPDPTGNPTVTAEAPPLTSAGVLPGNSTSLWQRIKNWF